MKKTHADEIVEKAIAMAGEEAQEAGSITFSPRCTILATLPHRDPGDIPFFFRQNGGYALTIQPGVGLSPFGHGVSLGYPYGSIPRVVLAWITTEAMRTKSRILGMGNSLADFLRELGLGRRGGPRGDITRLRDQIRRLFAASIAIHYQGDDRMRNERLQVAEIDELWWEPS